MTPADQLAIDIREAVEAVKRVAESLPGFTFGEMGRTMSGTAQSLVTIDAAPDQRPDASRSDG